MAKEKSKKKSSNIVDDPKVVVVLLSFIIVIVIALSAYNIKKIQEKGIEIAAQKQVLAETQQRAEYLKQLQQNAPTYLKMEEEYKLMMPETIPSEYTVLDDVCACAAQYGLEIESAEVPEVEQLLAKSVTVSLAVSGEYRNIINFCNNLVYAQKQIYRIDGFTMEKGNTDSFSREANIVISTFSKA